VRTKRAGERVMETLRRLYARLKLRINESKSAVAHVRERKFLGYSFWIGSKKAIRLRVSSKALEAMKTRVRRMTRRSRGRSMA
jgi:RNA-directed DNA polymerase